MAATFAGLGFGNAGVHIPHANAYPIAGRVRDYRPEGYPDGEPIVPHGMAVSLTAAEAFRFTFEASPERHLHAARLLDPDCTADGPDALPDVLLALMRDIGLPNGLAEVGYGDGGRRRPGRRLAEAAAAARHRAAGRDRRGPGRRHPRVDGALVTVGPGRGAAPPRRHRRRRLGRSPGRSTPPTRRSTASCRRSSSGRGTPTSCSPSSTSHAHAGVPITMRGAGTSIAGNAVGPGIVVDTARHLNRVRLARPGGAHRRGPARGRARHPAARGGAARAALRAGPVHAHPLHDRRDDRQQRLRVAGAGLRADGRQRGRAAGGVREAATSGTCTTS